MQCRLWKSSQKNTLRNEARFDYILGLNGSSFLHISSGGFFDSRCYPWRQVCRTGRGGGHLVHPHMLPEAPPLKF